MTRQPHLHILGICGTFMGSLALIARQAGYQVSGCDSNPYPPMSTLLAEQGVDIIAGFNADQVSLAPDCYVIGNVVARGNPLMEEILERGFPYISGPQWLAENILPGRHVLAVSGTHGKTTTASMLAWVLAQAQRQPSFLIGGVPQNFSTSAQLTDLADGRYFVIEADEYDTAFFDKRSKFVHYRPQTLIINNLEYDHADIFPDLAAIENQFHQLLRTMPRQALIVANGREAAIRRVVDRGLWSRLTWLYENPGWSLDGARVLRDGEAVGRLALTGDHLRHNALAVIAAAHDIGIPPEVSLEALATFHGVRRRLELRGSIGGITVLDDFAHHPTAIAATLQALRESDDGHDGRIIAVLEPRSNTMKMGVLREKLPDSLRQADIVLAYQAPAINWDVAAALSSLGRQAVVHRDLEKLADAIVDLARPGDRVLLMSNGDFGNLADKLLCKLGQHP